MFICQVCGYDKLSELPYDSDGNPSYEICNCCGFEFGFDDSSEGVSIDDYRKKWIEGGASWFNIKLKPEQWNLNIQLLKINSSIL